MTAKSNYIYGLMTSLSEKLSVFMFQICFLYFEHGFHCHGKESSMEFTYILIISLTSTAVLVGRDPLTFGKSLSSSTIRHNPLPFPSFQLSITAIQINKSGLYPALFVWRKKLCRTTTALTIICIESTLL